MSRYRRARPFEAVIADTDGVLTRTAKLHERAWMRMFDAFLEERGGGAPFTHADYRAHVDGRPRYDGAAHFLASRGIELPWGKPFDEPAAETVCGLGNRKNQLFLALLEEDDIQIYGDAVAALERWRRGGLRLAAMSASRNARRVLRAADLERHVDVVVDGELAAELGLANKPEIMLEAARRLGVDPADAVVFEDATAGVRAARQARFGLVLGVARDGRGRDLSEAGADAVVGDVFRGRFSRRLPDVLTRLDELSRWRADRPLALFLDFDGTLAPIVNDPAAARMGAETRAALVALAERFPVAVISGRDREDVAARVGIERVVFAGNHGFDIAGRGYDKTLEEASDCLDDVAFAEDELTRRVGCLSGVIIERKRFSVAVHYRQVASPSVIAHVREAVEHVRDKTGLRRRIGKMVLELEPAVDWDKGRALRWLMDVLPIVEPRRSFVIYVGDDETDEDAFAALRGDGVGVRVGDEVSTSLADYRAADPGEVTRLLRALA